MKITPSRIAARRFITIKTAMIVLFPTALIGFIDFFWKIKPIAIIPAWVIILIVFAQPVLIVFIVKYRLKRNHDGKLLEKLRNKSEKKLNKLKSEKKGAITELQFEGYYSIEKILPFPDHAFCFEIIFYQKVIEQAMPVISLNGVNLSLEIIKNEDRKVLCYAVKGMVGNLEKLVFISGKALEYPIKNPYYIKGNIYLNSVRWQCEGHSSEKNIFLDGNCFPNASPLTTYPFVLFVDGKRFGEYNGKYLPSKRYITLNVGNTVNKRICTNKLCLLKPAFGHTNIVLPHPEVFSRNKEAIMDVIF